MDNKFSVINSKLDIEDINRISRTLAFNDCWKRQYSNTIYHVISENRGKLMKDYPQEDLMKIALTGVKYVNSLHEIRRENERIGTDYVQSLNESQVTFNLIDTLFMVMGHIKLKNLVTTFPITKEYDGEKWQSKDYFYTMDVLSKMDWDKPLGRDKMSDLLWDYQNTDLRNVYIEYMCATSALYRAQTGKGIAEEWADDMGIPTYSVDNEEGFIRDNQTGKISKLEKSSHIQIVK